MLPSTLTQLNRYIQIYPRPWDWRMLDPVQGEINGIPSLRGYAVATNGIHVAIFNPFTVDVLFGHIASFVADQSSEQTLLDEAVASKTNKHKHKTKVQLLNEYITNV